MMEIVIHSNGAAQCVYSETIPVRELGSVDIRRASHVEPTDDGQWTADLTPVNGPVLGPFENRTAALAAETTWLRENWLLPNK
jgi:hypothetical protein